MFVALQAGDGTRVTSLAAEWSDRVEELRECARSGALVCPGCRQPLWLRTGEHRRRHFAHRQHADCPMSKRSAEVLETQAQLYEWLESKFPGSVQMDMPLEVPDGPSTADLLVQPDATRTFGYWVFDRQQRHREGWLALRASKTAQVHIVHTESTLSWQSSSELVLTASQRDFIDASDFDRAAESSGGHLHFFDSGAGLLRIFRGLHCEHAPNVYGWTALREGALAEARISPKSGEIVFAADVAARDARRRQMEARAAMRPARLPMRRRQGASPAPSPVSFLSAPPDDRVEPEPAAPLSEVLRESGPPRLTLNEPLTCEVCGVRTTEWVTAAPSAGTCVCRGCIPAHLRRTGGTPPTNDA